MAMALYGLFGALLLWLAHRFVRPLRLRSAVILIVLPMAFVGEALIGDRVYGPIDHPYQWEPLRSVAPRFGIGEAHNVLLTDIYSQMFPWRRALQLSLGEGRWPLWNPWILAGHPLAGAAQPAVFSPFTLLACLVPAAKSFTFTAAIAFLIAGLGTYLFGREIGCGEAAAFVAACGFMFSTGVAVYILWPLGFAWTLFPLVMVGTCRAVRERKGGILAVALTLSLLAGHPETVLHSVLLGSLFGVFELMRNREQWMRSMATAIGAGIVALLVSAIYVLPVVEAIPQSAEYEAKRAVSGQPSPPSLATLATHLLPHLYLRRWIEPDLGLLAGETSATGSIVLGLALVALVRRRRAETWFFAIAAFFCAAASWILGFLPLFDITHNERLAFAAAFFAAVLAGLGVQTLVEERARRTAAITLLAVLIALASATLWVSRHTVTEPASWGAYKIAAELGGLAIVIALIAARVPLPMIAIVLLAQRVVSDGGALKSFPPEAAYPRLEILEAVKGVPQPFRIVGQGLTLIPGTSVFYGLEDARGYEALTFAPLGATYRLWSQHQVVWFNRVDDLTRPFLSFLNVRYALTSRDEAVPEGWRVVARAGGSALLESANVIERAFIPRNVTLGRQDGDSFMQRGPVLEAMERTTDFRERAWIRASVPDTSRPNGPGRVTITAYRSGQYELDADMAAGGWIVLSDSAWKGWRASIDGRPVDLHRANIAFNAVFVPGGRHRVRVAYRPESFVIGRAISGATLAAIVIALIVIRTRSWRWPRAS